jgi:hypothetical protein
MLVVAILTFGNPVSLSAQPRVVAEGLKAPVKMVFVSRDTLLVAESGGGPNTGRVSIVRTDGQRSTLLDGLPSGLSALGEPSGVTALALHSRTLYIAIGIGDSTLEGAIPGTEIPNPAVSSPIMSSLLAVDFDARLTSSTGNFVLAAADHAKLAARQPVALTNGAGETATLRLVVDIPDYLATPIPPVPTAVKPSNPFGIELRDSCHLWLVDASRDTIWDVNVCHNTFVAANEFADFANPTPIGPPSIDAVPTSAKAFDDDLLVSFLSGFPFAAGVAQVKLVKPGTDESEVFFGGLQMVTEVLPYDGSPDGFLVLEFSTNPLAGGPGRVLFFDSRHATPVALSSQLITPTGMAVDADTGELLVAEIQTGRIVAIPLPR